MAYQRYAMVPRVTTYDKKGRPEYKLDYLSASYLGIGQIKKFSTFIISEDLSAHPELISNKFYDTTDLWWVICLYNGIIDPVRELHSGKTIRIPNLEDIHVKISSKTTALNTTKVILVN